MYKSIPQDTAHEWMSDRNVVVLDVREPDEYSVRHIRNAQNLPLSVIERKQIPFIFANKSATYLVYCRSGHRSKIAASLLDSLGYEHVFEFGGIIDWDYDTEP